MKTIITLLFTIHLSLLTLHVSEAQIIHVPADQPTIQAGINAASAGDTVLVADGSYSENINFNGKAIMVASHFIMDGDTNHINNTVIDGSQPANPDYGSTVSFVTNEDTTSVICGFTITGGTGMVDPVFGAKMGGGLVCYYAGAKIIHNKITGNIVASTTDAWGGGVGCFMETGDFWVILKNNTIYGNQCMAGSGAAEGGGMLISSNAWVENNNISNNLCSSTAGGADGGGIYHMSITDAKELHLMNNLISNNVLSSGNLTRGGGAIIWSSNCVVVGNTISMNMMSGSMTNGGGLFIRESNSATIKSNMINDNSVTTDNEYWGPGCMIVFAAGITSVENNEFNNNTGPEVVNWGCGGGLALLYAENSLISVKGNVFKGNQGRSGGGLFSQSCYNLKVINNLFIENASVYGGAVGMYIPASSEEGRPVFINNTLVNNTASVRGGAAHLNCETNLPIFFNSIFFGNSAPSGSEIRFLGSSNPIVISYSDIDTLKISGSWTGEENFNADPEFVSQDSLYHLSPTSPCINAGTTSLEVDGTVYYAPWVDYEGDWRPDPASDLFDVGADEYYQVPDAPVANQPQETGNDYFIADWEESPWAQRYYLDVSENPDFGDFVEGYENLDVGNVTSYLVEGLDPIPYYYRIRAHNSAGISENSNVIEVLTVNTDEFKILNSEFRINIYPNPTEGISHFAFHNSQYQWVSLKIYDLHGREVAVVLDEMLPAGEHVVRYDMTGLPAGVYFVELRAKGIGQRAVSKLVVL